MAQHSRKRPACTAISYLQNQSVPYHVPSASVHTCTRYTRAGGQRVWGGAAHSRKRSATTRENMLYIRAAGLLTHSHQLSTEPVSVPHHVPSGSVFLIREELHPCRPDNTCTGGQRVWGGAAHSRKCSASTREYVLYSRAAGLLAQPSAIYRISLCATSYLLV